MRDEILSPLVVLDETSPLVRKVSAPWLGLLWAGTLPLRAAQVYFFRELLSLGESAREYGSHLESLALLWTAALLPAIYVRGLFARACHLSLASGETPGREVWKMPAGQVANLYYTSLLAELIFACLVWTWVGVPAALLAGALACAAAKRSERPGLLAPLRDMSASLGPFRVVAAILMTFAAAFLVLFVNVYFLGRALVWAAGAIPGEHAARWEHLIRPVPLLPVWPAESLTLWLCLAGAAFFLEPFWIAVFCVLSHRLGLRSSGEDLRAWFRRARGSP